MGIKNRFLVASLVFATSSYFYGNYRFNTSRYEPQCETLPGLCFYGSVQSTTSEFKREQLSDKFIWHVKLCFGSNCQDLNFSYNKKDMVPTQIYGIASETCNAPDSKQIVFRSSGSWLAKGCLQDRSFGKAYEGIREVFLPSAILTPVCPTPADSIWCNSSSAEYCQLLYRLRELKRSNKRDACAIMSVIEGAAVDDFDDFISPDRVKSKIEDLRKGVAHFQTISRSESKINSSQTHPWDVIYFASVWMGLMLIAVGTVITALKNIFSVPHSVSGAIKNGGGKMEEKLTFEEQREKYELKIEDIVDRLMKAKNLDETFKLQDEFSKLSDEIEASGKKMETSLQKSLEFYHDRLNKKQYEFGMPIRYIRRMD
ncbi:hypothetical protein HZC07_04505 [Candidatus Micrarchaeota archaeon]|nr:hypothetical protein [Candidatus Micrarchaeota archaeon]